MLCVEWPRLKGASHEIEFGRIWYQKNDLEKLALRGWVPIVSGARAHYNKQITCFSAIFSPSNLTETSWKSAAKFCSALPRPVINFYRPLEGRYKIVLFPRSAKTSWKGTAKFCSAPARPGINFAAPFQRARQNPSIIFPLYIITKSTKIFPGFWKSATKFCSALPIGFSQIRREKIALKDELCLL